MAHDTTIDGYTLDSNGVCVQSDTTTEEDQNSDSFVVNASIKFNIYIHDKVKGTNPNIIEATRQALLDSACSEVKLEHYNGYSLNNDILIFDVQETGTDTWEVYFHGKNSFETEYNTNTSLFATVEKQKDGTYIGKINRIAD